LTRSWRLRPPKALREIGELVERTFEKAAAAAEYRRPAWRCIEQRELLPLLVGVEPRLSKCHHLAGESQAEQVFAAGTDAREEIAEALRQVHTKGTG
jgi:undecaprenyl pyrophosphate synthase